MRRSRSQRVQSSGNIRGTRSSFHSLEPAGQPGGGNVHREAFQGKRNKAEIAGRGHLKDLRLLEHGKRIVPFRVRPIVPEFPEPAANPAGTEKSVEAAREPLGEIAEKGRKAESAIP